MSNKINNRTNKDLQRYKRYKSNFQIFMLKFEIRKRDKELKTLQIQEYFNELLNA